MARDFSTALLDFDDTLISEEEYFRLVLSAFASRNDISEDRISPLLTNFWVERRTTPQLLETYLERLELPVDDFRDELFNDFCNVEGSLEPAPGSKELLDYFFAKGIKVVVLSNGIPRVQRNKWASVSLSSDDRITFLPAREVHLDKPDPETFRLIREEFGIEWKETLAIGDRYENDLEFPMSLGAIGYLVCPPAEWRSPNSTARNTLNSILTAIRE